MSLKSLWLHQQNMGTFPKANSSNTVSWFKPAQIYLKKSCLSNTTQPELISPSTQLWYPSCIHYMLPLSPSYVYWKYDFPICKYPAFLNREGRTLGGPASSLGTLVNTHSALTYETLAIYCLFNMNSKLLYSPSFSLSLLRHTGSYFPTGDWTCALCSGSMVS